MFSYTNLNNTYTDLSQNTAANNVTRGAYLMNIEHRYLLQKYYNNEGSFSIQTIGSTNQTLTAAPNINDKSATLSVAWPYASCSTVVTFSDGEVQNVKFTNNSTAISWPVGLVGTQFALTTTIAAGATTAILQTAWATATQTTLSSFSDGSTKSITYTKGSTAISWAGGLAQAVGAVVNTSVMTSAISTGGVQFYRMPPNYSKLKDITITVGNLKWTLDEIRTREEWDKVNVFPYYADIPKNFFIYPGGDKGGHIGIWPIPSTTGNIITFNYKFRVPDLSIADVVGSGGITASVSNGGIVVTGSGTSWTPTTNSQLESRWIQFAPTASSSTSGDNLWYQIASVDSATQLTLFQPYQGTSITSSITYTIGQMPILPEDFHDMLFLKALVYYFTAIKKDKERAVGFDEEYKRKLELLNEYSSSNTVNVNLSRHINSRNPNLYPYGNLG
jgi:hypothetical protein